jgi:hypothetical protein
VAWSGVVAGCKVLFVVGTQWWVVWGRRRMAFTDGGGAKWCAGSPVGTAMPGIALTRRRRPGAGIAQILRTGWFRRVHVRSEASYLVRARLAARTTLVRQRCEVDNQIRGLLKTFGILIGKAPGGLREASRRDRRRRARAPAGARPAGPDAARAARDAVRPDRRPSTASSSGRPGRPGS